MSTKEVDDTVNDFAKSAVLARRAGYDGVEIMGSEGYLINQMLTARTNDRTDRWGGSAENRMRFPVEIVERVREAVGDDFIVMYRMSPARPGRQRAELGRDRRAGQEARDAPACRSSTPASAGTRPASRRSSRRCRGGAFAWVTGKLKPEVSVPVVASNRINTPEVAEEIIASGQADLVSMARPLLSDPYFVNKAAEDRADEINTCIACNQACLDHTFKNKRASCMVNPRAGYETTLILSPTRTAKRIAVVGAGPAGLAAATELAGRGHSVELFESLPEIGGQFRLAMQIPGKEEFKETIRYYSRQMEIDGVKLHLGIRASVDQLAGLRRGRHRHRRRAAHPVAARASTTRASSTTRTSSATALPSASGSPSWAPAASASTSRSSCCTTTDESIEHWMQRWGVTDPSLERGGLATKLKAPPKREVFLLQRKDTELGKGLGKTSGWVHRQTLKDSGVEMIKGVTYDRIDDAGLHITLRKGEDDEETRVLEVDTIVLCTGQESVRDLVEPLEALGKPVHVIGGADVAAELDAKRAIKQATELAARL